MTTSNNGSNCGSQYGNNQYGKNTGNWATTGTTSSQATTGSATCVEPLSGNTYDVNEIPAAGCYVCNWNGSLLRISEAAFTSGGFTSFNFTSTDPLTVTYLCSDPAATLEECRSSATGYNVYCNF